jgi:hypothetical protein
MPSDEVEGIHVCVRTTRQARRLHALDQCSSIDPTHHVILQVWELEALVGCRIYFLMTQTVTRWPTKAVSVSMSYMVEI